MQRAKTPMSLAHADGPDRPPSQYLKISYSSKRFYRLMALARELGCSWQSIALEAIDELLDRESPQQNRP